MRASPACRHPTTTLAAAADRRPRPRRRVPLTSTAAAARNSCRAWPVLHEDSSTWISPSARMIMITRPRSGRINWPPHWLAAAAAGHGVSAAANPISGCGAGSLANASAVPVPKQQYTQVEQPDSAAVRATSTNRATDFILTSRWRRYCEDGLLVTLRRRRLRHRHRRTGARTPSGPRQSRGRRRWSLAQRTPCMPSRRARGARGDRGCPRPP